MQNLKYSPSEINTIRRLYKTEPLATIARRLGRTQQSVQNKARELGLAKEANWTPHELAILETYYPVRGADFVSKLIGRPTAAVFLKALKLGLSHRGTNGQ